MILQDKTNIFSVFLFLLESYDFYLIVVLRENWGFSRLRIEQQILSNCQVYYSIHFHIASQMRRRTMIKLFKFGQLQRHIETIFNAQFKFQRWGDKTSIYQKGINPLGVRNCTVEYKLIEYWVFRNNLDIFFLLNLHFLLP